MKHTEWTTAISSTRNDYKYLCELKENGIDGIEYSVSAQRAKECDWARFKRNADDANVALLSYHIPFGELTDISSPDEENRKNACEEVKYFVSCAAGIGIKRFVLHPSYEPIADSDREICMAQAKRSLAELAEFVAEYDAVLCVENLPRSCLGHNIAEMKELLSADARLRVCFDVNHLLLEFGCSHRDFVSSLGDMIVTCHMSDYDFVDEKHYFCGSGLINWDELIGLLEDCGYCGPFIFEGGFAPHRVNKDVPYGSIATAKERQMRIREFKGGTV